MGLFGRRVAKSTPNEGGIFWLTGNYLVEIDTVKVHEGRKKSDYFIVTGENKESDNEDRPVGVKPGWVMDIDKDASPGNVKLFLAGIYGIKLEDLDDDGWEKLADRVIEEDNPLNGFLAKLNVTMVKTRAGGDYSKHNWSCAYEDMDDMPEKALEILVELL